MFGALTAALTALYKRDAGKLQILMHRHSTVELRITEDEMIDIQKT